MKNASKYAEAIKGLCKALMKEGKPPPPAKMDPLRALVRGAMSANVSDARAEEVMKYIDQEFVNINELRVATELEIQEMLGARYPAIEKRVELITRALNAIFEKEHTLSLDRLRTISKRDARQFLRDLPEVGPFVEAYVMLYGFESPAYPMDDDMLAFFRERGIFDEKTTAEEAQRLIESTLKPEEYYDFFCAVRRALYAEADKGKKKARV